MKKLAYISGTLFLSLTLLSVVFKILHLQGATLLLSVGLIGISLIFFPAFAKYKYDQ